MFAEPPADLDTPSHVCQVALTLRGYTIPGTHNFVGAAAKLSDQANKAGTELQRTWMYQRQLTGIDVAIPYSHVHGNPDRDQALAFDVLGQLLPLGTGDEYRLILDIESWTFLEGWFGDAGNLEVWMRQSGLDAQNFDAAWCLIRTD